jgi:hypothetical protein
MTTDAVFKALSRFADRRGVPEVVVSDCQTSFVAADKVLQELYAQLDWKHLEELTKNGFKSSKGISWEFNTPLASHHGGVFETVVKALKRSLHAIYGYADLTLDEFQTAITNCEGLLNSRPLTLADPSKPGAAVLTPNHFLHGSCDTGFLPPTKAEPNKLTERWRHIELVQCHFWKRWHQEVLPLLHPRKKWKAVTNDIQPNTLVLQIDPNTPKGVWKLAIVQDVQKSRDGHVRSVEIRSFPDGSVYKRPITALMPLEIQSPA